MELDPKYASAIVRRYAADKGSTDDIKVIRDGKELPCSEVYVMTPFDLAHVSRQNGEGMMYINNDKHINVVAVSETAGETTPAAMAKEYVAMLKQTPDVSDLQTKVTDAEESGRKTTVVNASYTEPLNGQPAKLTVRSLFFEDNGQIWHVMYMYKDGDALAKEVVDHVFGQLK